MFRRWWWILLVMALVGPLLGLGGAALLNSLMPKKYESTAVVYLSGEEMSGSPRSVNNLGTSSFSPQFFGTEFEMIRSRKVLRRVVEKLDLAKRWNLGEDDTIRRLKKMIFPEHVRGTDLIRIRVLWGDPVEARDIALETAVAYRDLRSKLATERARKELGIMEKELRMQEEKVKNLHRDLATATGRQVALAAQKLDEEKKVLAQLRKEFRIMQIQVESPHHPILIHQEPVVPSKPCSPNVVLNLIAGLVLGLPVGLVLALPIMWLADHRHREARKMADQRRNALWQARN